jgi:hypothetical protein
VDDRLVLIQALIAVLTVAAALAAPRIQAAIVGAREARDGRLAELDRVTMRVRLLSKQIQSELVFPHLVSLKTVAPIHDLMYVSPDLNPDPEALSDMLRIAKRARELNYGPKQLLRWIRSDGERRSLIHELAEAERRFVASYWNARAALGAPWELPRKLRGLPAMSR